MILQKLKTAWANLRVRPVGNTEPVMMPGYQSAPTPSPAVAEESEPDDGGHQVEKLSAYYKYVMDQVMTVKNGHRTTPTTFAEIEYNALSVLLRSKK